MYPRRPLINKALEIYWAKGSAEYLSHENGNVLVNSADADHACDIRDRRSVSSSLHLLSGVIVAWSCNNKSISTVHSTSSEIIYLSSGIKKTIHIHNLRPVLVTQSVIPPLPLREIKAPSSTSKPLAFVTILAI
jgi:hypothetical protein